MLATGICHTHATVNIGLIPAPFPIAPGHEDV
ncbi:hypothetical protein CRD60_03060 [Bifidobacterium aemilianum]|uniref:Alcohol dehydrogenase n=1 Tax=Bifidobacterium aemilianum TaxID=2493120 RepID=A0A366K900_9BIFI|nr:hypothetical protein CRD60_03060 [Bifidobacterium aemilianum]